MLPPWVGAPTEQRKTPQRVRWGDRGRAALCQRGARSVKRGAPRPGLELAPGKVDELVAVLGDVLEDRGVAVEDGEVAVRELDDRLAPADDAPQDPRAAVDREVALDIDQAPVAEVAVQG